MWLTWRCSYMIYETGSEPFKLNGVLYFIVIYAVITQRKPFWSSHIQNRKYKLWCARILKYISWVTKTFFIVLSSPVLKGLARMAYTMDWLSLRPVVHNFMCKINPYQANCRRQLTGCLVHGSFYMGTEVYISRIMQNFWIIDVLICRRFGLPTFWFVDVLVCRRFAFWFFDVSVCRRFGLSTLRFVNVSVVDVSFCRRLVTNPSAVQCRSRCRNRVESVFIINMEVLGTQSFCEMYWLKDLKYDSRDRSMDRPRFVKDFAIFRLVIIVSYHR